MPRNLYLHQLSWLTWLLVAWASLTGSFPAAAQAPATVRIQPATMTLAPGETAGLTIAVEEGAGVFGVELNLLFDPSVLQIVDANPGQTGIQVQNGPYLDANQGLVVANKVDNEAGVVAYAMTLLAPARPVSGNGVLVEVTVRAVASGNSPLTLSAVLASDDGQALPAEVSPGAVTVSEDQGEPAPVTPTSPPTATPVPNTGQGVSDYSVTGSPAVSEAGPQSGEPALSPPEAPVQTAAARQATSEVIQTGPGLRPTGPAPTVTGAVEHSGSPQGQTDSSAPGDPGPRTGPAGDVPDGTDQSPPPSSGTGPDEEVSAVIASGGQPIGSGSEPESGTNVPDSNGNLQAIGLLALVLLLAGVAAFYLIRNFLSRER